MNVVSQLDREWSLIATGALAAALPSWQRRKPSLRRFATPTELLCFLQSAEGTGTDEALLALLELAAEDRLAGRFVLQALLPALTATSPRITAPHARRREVIGLMLFHAWETICAPREPPAQPPVRATLLERILTDTTRELESIEERPARAATRGERPPRECALPTLADPGCAGRDGPIRASELHRPGAAASAIADRTAA